MVPHSDGLRRRRMLALVGAGLVAGCTETRDPTDPPSTPATEDETPPPTTANEPSPTDTETTPEPRSLDGTWDAYGYDLANTGFNPETQPLTGRTVRWSFAVDGDNTLPEPAVTTDSVLIQSATYVYGIDRTDGTRLWRVNIDHTSHHFTPAVGDGVVFGAGRGVGGVFRGNDTPGRLAAIEADAGDVRWERDAFITSSPVLADGRLFHAAGDADTGYVRARAPDDGTELWTYAFGGEGEESGAFGTPAVADGHLLATGVVGAGQDATGRLVALDPATGQPQWTADAPASTRIAPACSDGDAFFSDEDGTLFAVDVADGSTRWTHDFEQPPTSKASVGNGLVYVLTKDTVHALDRTDGRREWSKSVGTTKSSVTVTSDAVYVGGRTMDAFDATSGARRWTREVEGFTGAFGVPVVVDGYMYVGVCVKDSESAVYDNYVYLIG